MYAIIEEGGKQYKVTAGDTIDIDRAPEADATSVSFQRVLLVGGEGQPRVGTPTVDNASVSAEIVGPRKGYHKHVGHRQKYLRVRITSINV